MLKIILPALLILCTLPVSGQSGNTLDDVLAEVVFREFPKWKPRVEGRPFTTSSPTVTSKRMHGAWLDGKSESLTINVALAGPEQLERERERFLRRSVMPKGGSVTGLGENAILLQTCRRVEVAFSKENIFLSLEYTFRRDCGSEAGNMPEYYRAAPKKEVHKASSLARIIYAAINSPRAMTPCYNDFVNPVVPRPVTEPERLLAAALNGDTGTIKSLLLSGISSSVTDKDGNASLHLAVRHGCMDTLRALIEAKSDLNARNLKGETPLMVAANLRQIEVAKLLIASGADVGARDKNGNNAAFYAVYSPHAYYLFPKPITRESLVVLLRILKEAGLDLNSHNDSYGDTLLTVHTGSGDRTEQWEDLIALGVDVNGVNRRGESALIKAVRHGVPDEGRIRIIVFLLAHGADVHIKDTDGLTALDYLRQDRIYRAKVPELVRNIDQTIRLLEEARTK